jgi:hypothetical protein
MNLLLPAIASLLAFWVINANAAIYVDKVKLSKKWLSSKFKVNTKYCLAESS